MYNYRNNSESVVKKYDRNYVIKYYEAMKENKKYLIEHYKDQIILQQYYNFVAFHVLLIAVNYCFHPNNKDNYGIKSLREVCLNDVFKEGIKKSDFNKMTLSRKVTLFTLKFKLYFITAIICRIRQKQNKTQKI